MTRILLLPGLDDSGPDHWQSLWESADPAIRRVRQRDWQTPALADWLEALTHAAADAGGDIVLVGHSLGSLLAVHWAARGGAARAALLVAPPDPHAAAFPAGATGFTPLPLSPLPFPAIVVGSRDDRYASACFTRDCAESWGARFVNAGAVGHVNADSRLGDWPAGRALLDELLVGTPRDA